MSLNLDKGTWNLVRFGDVVRNVNETVRDTAAAGIDRVIALEHLDGGELEVARWGEEPSATTFTKRVRPGQTLFGKRRAYQRKAAYSEFDAITSGDILVFEPAPDRLASPRILPELLPFLVQSEPFFAHALGTSAGSLSPRTNWGDLAKLEFALPPLDEQRRLSDLLWAGERHRRALRDELSGIPALRSAVAAEVDSAEATSIANIADIRNGQTFPKKYQGRTEGDYPFFKVSDLDQPGNERWLTEAENWVTSADVEELRAKLLEPGDVVTVRVGAALRAERRRMIRTACLVDDNHLIIHPTGIDPCFLWVQLSEIPLAASRNDGVVPSINQTIVGSVEIPQLSGAEQARVADAYLACFEAAAGIEAELSALAATRLSILQEVFG